MQDFFLKHFNPTIRENLIANQIKIIDLCVKNNIPLITLEYKAGGALRGKTTSQLQKEITKIHHREIIIKNSNSGFTNTGLDSILQTLKITDLLIMGINANGCVQDTAIGALRKGYTVITSQGIIASSSRRDLSLSKRNKYWYKEHTLFFETVPELLSHISRQY